MSSNSKPKPNEVMPSPPSFMWTFGHFGELGDALLPDRHDLGRLAGILADAQHAADMVADDRLVGEGAGEIDQVGQLRMEVPGVRR